MTFDAPEPTVDRTGVPEIDRAIEEFLDEPVEAFGDGSTVRSLRDPSNSHGCCQAVAEQFAEFARARGLDVHATDTSVDELGYEPTGPGGETLDENGEIAVGFYPEHTVAMVHVHDDPAREPWGRLCIVDFAASQYGYTDHPKVLVDGVSRYGPSDGPGLG